MPKPKLRRHADPRHMNPPQADPDLWVQGRKVKVAELVWDIRSPGLALAIRPSGRKAWRVMSPLRWSAAMAAARRRPINRSRRCKKIDRAGDV